MNYSAVTNTIKKLSNFKKKIHTTEKTKETSTRINDVSKTPNTH